MIFRSIINLIAISSVLYSAEKQDLLRFKNGDQLHGTFQGISKGSSVIWERDDVNGGVNFKTSDLRQIVLQGGRPDKALGNLSHIGTTNGDRIPGRVRELDGNRLILETEFGGVLEIPKERVGLIAPSPLGGRILYYGPFHESEWLMIDNKHPDGLPVSKIENEEAEDKVGEGKEVPRWNFSGSAWYWQNDQAGTGLVRKSGMPDRSILQFQLAWKNRLSLAIGFHSNFEQPAAGEDQDAPVNPPGHPNSLPGVFGESYVLHLYSNYVVLYRTYFDEDGKPRLDRVRTNNSGVRLADSGTAKIELRCNRKSGEIVLFVDDEFVVQWSEPTDDLDPSGGYAGKGDGFGFVVQSESSPVRVSEVIVAEWNGMPDAARSLQIDDADIVLLANGTDRFSGKVTSISDGKLSLEGRYGNFTFPMDEVAEIRFAKDSLEKKEELASDSIKVRFYPLGRISGQPLSGDSKRMQLLNGAAGEINLNLESAVMLEFQSTESYLDDWDIDF